MKAVIASSAAPKPEHWNEFVTDVVAAFPEIEGLTLLRGPGCWNYGVVGLDESQLNDLTMALMPARWTNVSDDDDGVAIGEFADKR